MFGRTVRLFLVDGAPTGLLTAEVMNWTGHALVAPRSRLGDAIQREEATRTGVYFLIGDDPAVPSKARVYVGEGDNIAERLKSHAKDPTKDFWNFACLITSKDTNLTKAHVRYLEHRFLSLIIEADRALLANGNEPSPKLLPESDMADMEFFIAQVKLVLPVVGFDFLRLKPSAVSSSENAFSGGPLALVLESGKYGYKAEAVELNGEITVLAGSTATAKNDFVENSYSALREQLIKDKRLIPSSDPDYLQFNEQVTFPSPSAAAAVIRNRNTNGRTSWKLKSTGQSLKDWQDAQLSLPQNDLGPTISHGA